MSALQIAEKIAREGHKGQFRRNGSTPYIRHPERVAESLTGDSDAQALAWLHDILEDTSTTDNELQAAGIPENIINAVKTLTKNPGVSYNDYLSNIKENTLAKKVKIQDMLDNLADNPTEQQIVKYEEGLAFLKAVIRGAVIQ